MPLTEEDQDLIEVIIACTNGQIGREAAREVMGELDAAGFEIVRKQAEHSANMGEFGKDIK